ncbi:CDP-glycerol glycerophosphotransferase family protein [Thalassotalea ponticola]|uniref:CDP-glycerol glycerophosphotransferase family protein n=1 Tax=Thalassotalea ponticola TaxID=1523392 RepID=UPI0025B37E3C|nr:CDP-glycerol glycerophosphotransferase family protein [Thalassotalea ponticola]MDN3651953.1 CDP-glycerol glycerophosphotransferase family protein [Thalassotalea ponticola]
MKVFFDVLHLYYLPQYLPVHQELQKRGIDSQFVFYHGAFDHVLEHVINEEQLAVHWVDNDKQALEVYVQHQPDWVFFANSFDYLEQLHKVSKSAQMGHGIGPKSSYYTQSATTTTVRFVEGEYRCQRLRHMYPEGQFVDVGFSKLDPILNSEEPGLNLDALGLDSTKPTLAYAPTFYPSSIEKFAKNWPDDFKQYNILIKPHYFSVAKSKYRKHKQLLEYWARFDNVYLANDNDYSLVPFLASADVLISDASSALFEFAALNKPVVWCDFLKLRLSYSGPLKFRFNKRMDQDYGDYANIAVHARSYSHLKALVNEQYQQPQQLAEIRLQMSEKLAGTLDGKASERIVDYLCAH